MHRVLRTAALNPHHVDLDAELGMGRKEPRVHGEQRPDGEAPRAGRGPGDLHPGGQASERRPEALPVGLADGEPCRTARDRGGEDGGEVCEGVEHEVEGGRGLGVQVRGEDLAGRGPAAGSQRELAVGGRQQAPALPHGRAQRVAALHRRAPSPPAAHARPPLLRLAASAHAARV